MSEQNGKRKPTPLFNGFWFDVQSGQRLGRASRLELREAARIYWKHRRRLGERVA